MEQIVTKFSNRMIYILSAIGFFGIFSTTISKNPVLPLFVHDLGGSEAVLGLIAAISPLAGIIFSFPIGFLIDKIGQKKLLFVSAMVFVTAPVLYAFVINPWYLIPIRFFHGLATAILGPLSATMIFHAYPQNKGEKLGFYSSATLIGRTLAPLLGGVVITSFLYLGGLWNYRLVYFLAAIVSLPILFLAFAVKTENHDVSENKSLTLDDFLQTFKNFIHHGRLLTTAFVEMATYFTFGVLETYLPLYLHDCGYSGSKIGLIFSLQILAIALSKPFFGKIADRIDKRVQIIVGMLILGLSIIPIPFVTNFYLITALSMLFGVGMSVSTVATNSYVGDITPKSELGASMGALSAIMDIGHSSGPFITGLIITYLSFSAGFWFAPVVCLMMTGLFVVVNFRKIV